MSVPTQKVGTYGPGEVIQIIGPITLEGINELIVERYGPPVASSVAMDGAVVHVRSADRRLKITAKLVATSPSNDLLSALQRLDEATPNGAGVVPAQTQDASGRSLWSTAICRIMEIPAAGFKAEAGERQWVFEYVDAQWFIGGNQ